MRLDPIAVDQGVSLETLDSAGSTNSEALDRARRGIRGPRWITANTQTAGRGRKARSWVSPPGNLYATLLLTDPAPFERAPELAFVAALALRDAILIDTPQLEPKLGFKWPNDLLLADEKCAGILIEGETSSAAAADGSGARLTVVVGIGVNCVSHPMADPAAGDRPVLYPATDLSSHGAAVGAEELFMRLSASMCRRLAQWDAGRNFDGILGDWLHAARGIGGDVTVRDGDRERTGRFVGLDCSGRLLLELPGGGFEKISAGDVFPLTGGDRRRFG
jgi:BirA family biotin operon repressor/biotin-[acetyl-CoA-carboxylase] ligase